MSKNRSDGSKTGRHAERKAPPSEDEYYDHFPDAGRELRANSSIERLESWTNAKTSDRHAGNKSQPLEDHYYDNFPDVGRELRANSSVERLESWTNAKTSDRYTDNKSQPLEDHYYDNFPDVGRELRANSSVERLETWTKSKTVDLAQQKANDLYQDEINREMRANSSLERFESWTKTKTEDSQRISVPPIFYETEYDNEMNRELRANSSVERMETWTGSMMKNNPSNKMKRASEKKQAAAAVETDEYEDDDFEDYDEDFEEEEEEDVAPSRTTTTTTSARNSSNTKISSSDHLYAPDKYNATYEQPKPQSKAIKQQYNNVKISLNTMKITDPRLIRIQKLLATNVMELNTEKHTIFNAFSCSLYDLYMRNLRLTTSTQRQIGVPVDLEKRDIDCNTDSIDTMNKSIQYSYGDDTAFYRICEQIKKKQLYANNNKKKDDNMDEYKSMIDADMDDTTNTSTGTSTTLDHMNIGGILGATRFTTFLQNSSRLCEHLLSQSNTDSHHRKDMEESKSDSSNSNTLYNLLDTTSDSTGWSAMDKNRSNGGNEMIRTRRISCVKFSTLQSHIVMTAHPYPTEGDHAELDLKPYKGLYCVWDAGSTAGPQYVLEGSGQPTVCCFSATQAHFLLAGTLEGSLHLWDLREDNSLHKDRDAIDLHISRGIRKPCYSTSLPFLAMNSNAATSTNTVSTHDAPADEEYQHSSPIIQIESLNPFSTTTSSAATAVISQFVSIDEAGLVIFWVTSEKNLGFLDVYSSSSTSNTSGNLVQEDVQRSPWGNVVLVQTRQIHTHSHTIHKTIPLRGGRGGGAVLQGPASMACIPHDLGTLLVSGNAGEVSKVSRYGKPTAPVSYHRIATGTTTATVSIDPTTNSSGSSSINDTKNKNKELKHYAAVSYMTVRPAPSATSQLAARAQLQKNQQQQQANNHSHRGEGKEQTDAATTTTAVYSTRNMLARAPLLLVGRVDGTIDLFHLEDDTPICTWNLTSYTSSSTTTTNPTSTSSNTKKNSNTKNETAHQVVFIQWSSTHPNSFFIADISNRLYHFNLRVNHTKPVSIESINVTNALNTHKFDISKPRSTSIGNYFLATTTSSSSSNNPNDILYIHRGNNKVHKVDASQYDTEEMELYENLYQFTALRNNAHIVHFIPYSSSGSSSNNSNDDRNYKK